MGNGQMRRNLCPPDCRVAGLTGGSVRQTVRQGARRRRVPTPRILRVQPGLSQIQRLVLRRALVLTVALFGCEALDNPYAPYPEPSFNEFVTSVQPIVRKSCAYLACHGTLERSLSVYAVGFLRAPPPFAGTSLDEHQLTDEELAWNFDSLRVRAADGSEAAESALLLKCLDPVAGGIEHADGLVIFEDRSHPDYQSFELWVEGRQ